jgi:quinol-cytochrome oxidoreductase complex cytochrome b subunit
MRFLKVNFAVKGYGAFVFYGKWFSSLPSLSGTKSSNNLLLNTVKMHGFFYPTPSNLNYGWSYGFLSAVCLGLQIVTGLLCAVWYIPDINVAFESVRTLMVDVPYGWFLRYIHANGASLFFFIIYIHLFRGFLQRSYIGRRQFVWYSGFILFLLLVVTAFLGYTLPCAQMSYWAATVITNLLTVVPVYGIALAQLVWGDYAFSQATLSRFYVLHYLLPFVMLGFSILHLNFLHLHGSSHPVQTYTGFEYGRLNRTFMLKDLVSALFYIVILLVFVF